MERLTHQGKRGPYWDKSVFDKHGGMEEDLIIDRLAYYEDLEEQGRLLTLPCKIGDIVYCIIHQSQEIVEDVVEDFDVWSVKDGLSIRIRLKNTDDYLIGVFGKTVFLSREEAEASLRR